MYTRRAKTHIVVILAVIKVREDLIVVDPHVLGRLDTNGIAILSQHLGQLQVSDNDIFHTLDVEANSSETRVRVQSENGGVAARVDLGGAGDGARDVDYFGRVIALLDGIGELRECANRRSGSAFSTSGTTPDQQSV